MREVIYVCLLPKHTQRERERERERVFEKEKETDRILTRRCKVDKFLSSKNDDRLSEWTIDRFVERGPNWEIVDESPILIEIAFQHWFEASQRHSESSRSRTFLLTTSDVYYCLLGFTREQLMSMLSDSLVWNTRLYFGMLEL